MATKFTSINRYVPQWYQHLFILDDRRERRYPYLDLKPDRIPNPTGGGFHFRNERRTLGAINYIMKSGARRFIAVAKRQWLHPEKHFAKTM